MVLRPKAFSIPSSTQLKITFNLDLSPNLTVDNFEVESLNGAVDNLEIISLEITDSVVLLKTRPQVAGNYYLLKLKDTNQIAFISDRSVRLIDDTGSRSLFFVGIDNVNPIRDAIFEKVPSIIDLDNSNLKNILSAQADELLTAQKKLGELLSDNYISIEVKDEFKVRTSGAVDRMANEQAYAVNRVSKKPSNTVPLGTKIIYTTDNDFELLHSIPHYPISLQEKIIENEEITNLSEGKFDGFLVTVSKSNIIRLLTLKVIRADDVEDCDGNIGTEYNIERFKYALKDNFYDQDYAFKYVSLEKNQILLSDFGNITVPIVGDTIILSYLFKDESRAILPETILVSSVIEKTNESVPTNSVHFFLNKAPIVNSSNEIPVLGGLTIRENENSSSTPTEFTREIPFDIAKLPSSFGEFSVNYTTGEVFLVGSTERNGTGRNNYVVSYLYRKEFYQNLDYSISNFDFVATPNRSLANTEAEISFDYDNVYVPDIDYKFNSHIEVFAEQVQNRVSQAFAIETLNAPITNIYRILNQTTGEVYNPLYSTGTEIFFSGNRSPEIKSQIQESANFLKISNEKLEVTSEFIIPVFEIQITSNSSTNSIEFYPKIPAELISTNSTDYFIRAVSGDIDLPDVEDTQIRFFGDPDSNNLIGSFAISATASVPSRGIKVLLGTQGYIIALAETGIMNSSLDGLGSNLNSSVSFNSEYFENEKYFVPISSTAGFKQTSSLGLSVSIGFSNKEILYSNLTRLRKVGDYAIDYENGLIYLSVGSNTEYTLGYINYACSRHVSKFINVLTTLGVSKKNSASDSNSDAIIIYDNNTNGVEHITLTELESPLTVYNDSITAFDLNGEFQAICIVLDDYTAVLPNNIKNLNIVTDYFNVIGQNLNASFLTDRQEERTTLEIQTPVTSGGYNLYDGKTISFVDNVIDLKKTVKRRAYAQDDGTYVITINDPAADSFYECKRVQLGSASFFDVTLNISKISNVKVLENDSEDTLVYVEIETDNFDDIDTDNDFLLDSDGNRFLITAVDSDTSIITVSSPAINDVTVTEPIIDSVGISSIVVKPIVSIVDGLITITFPEDSGFSSGELFEIIYLTSYTPVVGTKLAVDYRYGDIYFDYNYVYDQIAVWYEYGDNALDWSISSTLSEGDEYFVSYKYGANREALRRNFGTLTQVPFFQQFPLDIDRELYRNGVKGTLQAFAKGPTVPAFNELVQSFTEIKPEITEINFGSWILGRDYIHPKTVNTEGNLQFGDGKFSSGLVVDDQTVVSIPAISNLPLREGTLEGWVRPNWSGINNDATLTFSLDGIGQEKYVLSANSKIFDSKSKWEIAPLDNLGGIYDVKGLGFRISNFKTVDGEERYEAKQGGVYKEFEFLNRATQLDFETKAKILDYGTHLNRISAGLNLSDNFTVGNIFCTDKTKAVGFSFELSKVDDLVFDVVEDDLDTETIPEFNRLHRTRSCSCAITNNISILSAFNTQTITIDLNETIAFDSYLSNFEIIDDCQSFVIIDANGDIYQVEGFVNSDNITSTTLPDEITKIIVNRIPVNNSQIKQASVDEINDLLPTGSISLYAKNVKILGNSDNNELAFNYKNKFLVNWSNYNNFRINLDAKTGLVEYYFNFSKYKGFYTDSLELNDFTLADFSNTNSDNHGIYFACLDNSILSTLEIYQSLGTLYNRFNLSDIYIGRNAYNPKRMPFSVSKDDTSNIVVGLPNNSATNEGIFIGFDELCISPLADDIGQWVFKTRADKLLNMPSFVTVNSFEDYTFTYSYEEIDHLFSGSITTDGEFSSVVRSTRDEIDGSCANGIICDKTYRYCGNELLEDSGWRKLEESDSDLVNLIVGGRESSTNLWRKMGDFNSSASSGIYRAGPSEMSDVDSEFGSALFAEVPCSGGNTEYLISMRIAGYSAMANQELGSFSGSVSGNLTGITPIHYTDNRFNIKLVLALDSENSGLLGVLDGGNNNFIDLIRYNWTDDGFHEYKLMIDYDNKIIKVYLDELLSSQVSFDDFESNLVPSPENSVGFYVFDQNLLDSAEFHETFEGNILDVDLIYFSGFYQEGTDQLESTDIFIQTDDRIEFEFNIDGLDGYGQELVDGYDGYSQSIIGTDEIFMSSDRLRYFVDTGLSESKQRFSVFKDGKGFLNFRILEKITNSSEQCSIYNIATAVKNWAPGELHHIAVSWRLNSLTEDDQMHLFIDGQEVPNLYRFGGLVPVRLNERYSDVSKEVLHNFLIRNIIFPEAYTDGAVAANSDEFTSNSLNFTDDMVGKSLIITAAPVAIDLVGSEFIIIGVENGVATIGRGTDLTPVTFSTSDSQITFKFVPYISDISTDLKNTRFVIFKTDNAEVETELNGVLYSVTDGAVDIISGENVESTQYRVNVDTRLIEFIGQDADCNFVDSIKQSDVDIHIKTYGLNLEIYKEKINLSGSSYITDDNKFSGQSVLSLYAREPVSWSDVSIKRIILDKTVVEVVDPTLDLNGKYISEFEIELETKTSKVSTDYTNVYKANTGRYLALIIDTDNINFCDFETEDGYQDGYLDGQNNTITIYGETTDGVNEETFFINKNGKYTGEKLFKTVDSISGTVQVVDPNYDELAVISIEENNDLSVSDSGEATLEIYKYQSGHFILAAADTEGVTPFELHTGTYQIEYPTLLRIDLKEVGPKLYIGCDINKQNQFGGAIDEFRILSEMSSDTRITESVTSGTRSITDDYYRANPFCPDEKTLALIHFNDPLEVQKRKLRNMIYLDQDANFKYKLTAEQLKNLLPELNNEFNFIKMMMNYNFTLNDATKTFIECHKAEGGPIWNEADYYKNYTNLILSENSLNSRFGNSAFFNKNYGLILDNNAGYFRKAEGTIEFWVAPTIDTQVDDDTSYYFDVSSTQRIKIASKTSKIIELPNAASKIISIKLINKRKVDSSLYTSAESEQIIFDELARSEISGVLEGGSGVDKDFSKGHTLSADGYKIFLAEPLPGTTLDVAVAYIPIDLQGDRISIFKNQYSQIVFAITADGIDNYISTTVNWKKNTWHRIKCTYKTNSNSNDYMRLYVDGENSGIIKYGTGLIYGDGLLYGQYIHEDGLARNLDYKIALRDDFKLLTIGNNIYGDHSAKSRIDNMRLSRVARNDARDATGALIDGNYSSNTNTVSPVVKDDATTLLLDFDASTDKIDKFIKIIDPKNGIFNFTIDVIDNFDKVIGINNGQVEDLIVELVGRLKPAHTNAYVKFKKSIC